MKTPEIYHQLRQQNVDVSARTIRDDVAALHAEIIQTIEKKGLHSLQKAFAEFELLWREMCTIYFSKAPTNMVPQGHGKNKKYVEKEWHAALWRPQVIDRLIKLAEDKAKLAGLFEEQVAGPGAGKTRTELEAEIISDFTNTLPALLRNGVVEYFRQKVKEEGLHLSSNEHATK